MKHSERIAPIAAVASAVSTVACCLPTAIASAAGAAGLGAVVAPLRPWLLGISAVLLAIGFVQLYRRNAVCQRRNWLSTAVLLFSAALVLSLVLFPQSVAGLVANL